MCLASCVHCGNHNAAHRELVITPHAGAANGQVTLPVCLSWAGSRPPHGEVVLQATLNSRSVRLTSAPLREWLKGKGKEALAPPKKGGTPGQRGVFKAPRAGASGQAAAQTEALEWLAQWRMSELGQLLIKEQLVNLEPRQA